jgi:hypothetical protein
MDGYLFTGLMNKAPAIGCRQIGISQADVVFEIAGMGRTARTIKITGSSDEATTDVAEVAHLQGRVRQRRDAKRKVEPAIDEFDPLVAKMQINRYLGIGGEERWQNRRDMGKTKGHRHREADLATRRRRLGNGRRSPPARLPLGFVPRSKAPSDPLP